MDISPNDDVSSPRTLLVDLAARFGGASARAIGVLSSMPSGQAALACLDGTPVLDRARYLGLEVYPVASNKLDPRIVPRLAAIVRGGGFGVVDTQNSQSKLWGTLAAAQSGAAVVSTLNSWYEAEHQGSLKGRFYQQVERATSKNTAMFITVAPDIRDYLISSGVDPDRVALILNAVEIDPDIVPGDAAWLRQQFDLPDSARVVCAVGRLVPAKGYTYLVTAFEELASLYPDLHCVIVGDGELRDALTEQIARSSLQDRFHLAGFRSPDEVLSIVKASDFFAMPSVTEGTPIALLEAGALGKPIIASRVGGIPDILTHEQTGLLTAPGQAQSVATALRRLLDNGEFARELGEAAHHHVAQNFSRKAQVAATLDVYQRAYQQRHQRAGLRIPRYT